MRVRAFTLIELLVAVAIVGVLASLALGAARAVRAQAAAAACVSNLRQWGTALGLYVLDHDGDYPRRGQGVQPVTILDRPQDWFNALPPYVGMPTFQSFVSSGGRARAGDHSLFVCPSAVDNAAMPNFLPYAMNMYLSPWIRPQPHNRREIPNPQQLAFLADGPGGWSSAIPSSGPYSILARHGGNGNVCFVDGHVQTFTGTYLGCQTGEPIHPDIRWQTLTTGINQAPLP